MSAVLAAISFNSCWPFSLINSLLHVGLIALSILPASKSHEMPIISLIHFIAPYSSSAHDTHYDGHATSVLIAANANNDKLYTVNVCSFLD